MKLKEVATVGACMTYFLSFVEERVATGAVVIAAGQTEDARRSARRCDLD
jgi:hypothetical protein